MTAVAAQERGLIRVLAEVWVPGQPATKGSVDVRPNGTITQAVAGSAEWARLVTRRVRDWRRRHRLTEAFAGPAGVRCVFFLTRPSDARYQPDALPVAARSGDADKLARNVLDALTAAGAYVDDTQVVRLLVDEVYCRPAVAGPAGMPAQSPGALIQCWALPDWEVRKMIHAANLARARIDADLPMFAERS